MRPFVVSARSSRRDRCRPWALRRHGRLARRRARRPITFVARERPRRRAGGPPKGAPVRLPVSPAGDVDHEDESASFARAMGRRPSASTSRGASTLRLPRWARLAPPAATRRRRSPPSPISSQGRASSTSATSVEYVEGAVVGLDPRILRRLRHGEFAYQAYLDLHGMIAAAARVAVERFIIDCVRYRSPCRAPRPRTRTELEGQTSRC